MKTTSRFYLHSGKRILDLLSGVLAVIVLSPVLILVSVVVRFKLGSPVLFQQSRPGLNGKPFVVTKFRTMTDARDEKGNLLPDSDRLTRFGRFLRSTSLDELPELINVIRGEMSLVGPRPLRIEYLSLYTTHQARRHEVRPGITGWAQVNGRNALTWEERFDLDVWYVDNLSFRLDASIILRTIGTIIRRDGINAEGQATMYRFTGTKPADPDY